VPERRGEKPVDSLKERVVLQETQIKELKKQLDIMQAAEKAVGPVDAPHDRPRKAKSLVPKPKPSDTVMHADDNTVFRREFDKQALPIKLGDPLKPMFELTQKPEDMKRRAGRHVVWVLPKGFNVTHLDIDYYLPIFLSGLVEIEEPYGSLAEQTCRDVIRIGGAEGRLFTAMDKCIAPIKAALRHKSPVVVQRGLCVLEQLMTCDMAPKQDDRLSLAEFFVSFLPLILPILSITRNLMGASSEADRMETAEKIVETLSLIVRESGREEARRQIKQQFPDVALPPAS